eukprot:6991251-Pyramimonas_sp.AAC.1
MGAVARRMAIAAIWGALQNGPESLDAEGKLTKSAPPIAVQMEKDVWTFARISGAGDFFESRDRWGHSWKALFLEDEVREFFLKLDAKHTTGCGFT